MKIFLRLLSFSKPYKHYIPEYIAYVVPAVIFGAFNLTLFKPLFDVLFEIDPKAIASAQSRPEFNLSLNYLLALIQYFVYSISLEFGKIRALELMCGIIFIGFLLSNFFKYMSQYVLARMRTRLVYNLKKQLFSVLSSLHLGYFSNQRKGNILSTMSADVQEIETSVVSGIQVFSREPLMLITYFVILISISWELTLFTVIVFPVTGLLIAKIAKSLRKSSDLGQTLLGKLLNITEETISGNRIIKAFSAQNYIQKKFDKDNELYRRTLKKLICRRELAGPLSEVLGVLIVIFIVIYGGSLVLSQNSGISASEFMVYILIYTQLLPPIKNISNTISNIQRGISSGERVFNIIDSENEIKNKPNANELLIFKDKIEYKNLFFAYNTEEVLKNINITIPKGKMVALVGQSGSGKSTCADLLCRFYDPQRGSIAIDGIDIRDYTKESVRGQMGIVTQEAILFNDTIFNNIAFGIENAKEEDVIKAAKIANAHDFIMETENGYQTNIGDRGLRLSGGQRQRISIARAILKNPSILILDEATSALDTESEKLVQEAIQKLMENRTSLVIAHRLSTIQHADEIIVMEKGEIVERGTHKELYHNSGIYRKLCDMQSFA